MRRLETDYLVLGAGASALSFADALTGRTDAEVLLVDRRHAPGGHWLDAYPFVRLHQPSAWYGAPSLALGRDRIDTEGPNAGFYERSGAAEICAYFEEVHQRHLEPRGVRFLPLTEHRGEDADGHHLVSLFSGEETVVRVRKRLVDATCIASEVPLRHELPYGVDEGIRMIPPNWLPDLQATGAGFTVIGGGKTGMDTVGWLLAMGVDADRIRWIRSREAWMFDRATTQPLELVASYARMQANWLEAAATADDASAFAHSLEERGVFVRIDPSVEPGIFRGATISRAEIDDLRTVERTVLGRRVKRVSAAGIELADGERLPSSPAEICVDCTAAGAAAWQALPIFSPGLVRLGYVTVGFVTWSAALVGAVLAGDYDDADRNRLCRSVPFPGEASRILEVVQEGLLSELARGADPNLSGWTFGCRLNPNRDAIARLDDPEIAAAFTDLAAAVKPALSNLARLAGEPPDPAPAAV